MASDRLFKGIFIGLLSIAAGCASKQEAGNNEAHGTDDEIVWQEMDDFHMIMAETFHPYKDSSDLEPAKTRALELMTAADLWASSPLPEKVDNETVRTKLQQLKNEAATLAQSVRSQDDNVIGEQLTALHDTFHQIQEAWYGEH